MGGAPVSKEPRPVDGWLLSPDEVAERLGTTPAWVREQVRSGRLGHYRLSRRTIRVAEDQLADFLHVHERIPLIDLRVTDSSTPQRPVSTQGVSSRAHGVPSRAQPPEALFPATRLPGRGRYG